MYCGNGIVKENNNKKLGDVIFGLCWPETTLLDATTIDDIELELTTQNLKIGSQFESLSSCPRTPMSLGKHTFIIG
jgi:hypothetical protein